MIVFVKILRYLGDGWRRLNDREFSFCSKKLALCLCKLGLLVDGERRKTKLKCCEKPSSFLFKSLCGWKIVRRRMEEFLHAPLGNSLCAWRFEELYDMLLEVVRFR